MLAARGVEYPWSEQMARKMLRNVEKTRSSNRQNAPSEDRKCWQRIELGIHGLKSWGRNWSRKAGRVHRACDDAALSISVRLCDASYLLSSVREALLAANVPLATVLPPHAADGKLGSFFPARFRLYLF